MLSIVERFISINGEGAHAGETAAFLRFRGCNLSCSYCDTKWANERNTYAVEYTAEQLAQWVKEKNVHNVTLTGGEPLLQDDIDILITLLLQQGNRVEIETNGSIPLDRYAHSELRPVFTMDYKLPSSGMEVAMRPDNFKLLGKHDAVKFVAGTEADLIRAREIIDEFKLTQQCHLFLSPVHGKISPASIVDFMITNHMDHVRVQLQLHKYIWGTERKGV